MFDTTGVGHRGFGEGKFADPFLLPSSESMPKTLHTALDFCLFLYFLEPNFRQATRRIASHFMNPIEFDGKGDEKEQKEHKEWLTDELDVPLAMLEMGEEWGCYGNSFWRLHTPFLRWLIDYRGNFNRWAISMFPQELVKYNSESLTYTVPDPLEVARGRSWENAAKVQMRFADTKSLDRSRIKLRKIDPRRVILLSSWMSGRTQVIYRFDEQFVNQIKASRLFQVNETPIALLQAISNGEDFLFNEDEIFHFRAPTISGVSNHGWGLPETMANYRSLHQLMVYRRIDEAVGLDYILPWRILSPNLGDKLGDLADLTNLGMWKQSIADMIARQRKDPFAVHALPFPVEYQEANGKGKEIVPKDLIEWQVNNMLDGYGIPAELFRGTLAFAAQPTALRLFQNNFRFIYSGFNKFLKWSSKGSQDFLQQERLTPKLQQPTIADDMEAKSVYLQLAAGGDLSRSTAYAGFNVNDPVAEALKRMKEDMAIQQGQQKLQAEAQRQQELGSLGDVAAAEDQASGADGSFPGSGAAGAPPTNQGGLTPMDAQQKAMDLAQQWAACPDNGQRAKMMRQAEATDQMTYALAKQLWEKMKADGASQGRKAVTSGQAGGQGGGQAPPPQ